MEPSSPETYLCRDVTRFFAGHSVTACVLLLTPEQAYSVRSKSQSSIAVLVLACFLPKPYSSDIYFFSPPARRLCFVSHFEVFAIFFISDLPTPCWIVTFPGLYNLTEKTPVINEWLSLNISQSDWPFCYSFSTGLINKKQILYIDGNSIIFHKNNCKKR